MSQDQKQAGVQKATTAQKVLMKKHHVQQVLICLISMEHFATIAQEVTTAPKEPLLLHHVRLVITAPQKQELMKVKIANWEHINQNGDEHHVCHALPVNTAMKLVKIALRVIVMQDITAKVDQPLQHHLLLKRLLEVLA